MRMMNGIECAAVDANFFQDDSVNPLINEIWRTLTVETRDIASPGGDNARRRNAVLQLPPNRRAAVDFIKDIELAGGSPAKQARTGSAVQFREHIDPQRSQLCRRVRL